MQYATGGGACPQPGLGAANHTRGGRRIRQCAAHLQEPKACSYERYAGRTAADHSAGCHRRHVDREARQTWSGVAAETQDTSNSPSTRPNGCDACWRPVSIPEADLNQANATLASGRDPVAPWQYRGGQVPPAVRLSYTMDRRHSAPTDGLGTHNRSAAPPRLRPARGSRRARVRMRTHSCLKWNPECCPRHLPMW